MKKIYEGIGVMTGTSLDAIDLAYCRFEEQNDSYVWVCLLAESIEIEARWRDRLMALPQQTAEIYAKTHVYLAHYLGKNIANFIHKHQLRPQFVAVHGQTIFHQPHKNFTAQIGDGETLVSYLQCPLVCNFRNKDVALGGEGAPLVPLGEKYLFPDTRLFLNLGGFANVSYGQQAFDIAPCNLVLNALLRAFNPDADYDRGGQIARAGKLLPELLAALNALPYYRQKAPKSLGSEWVEQQLFPIFAAYKPELADGLHTFCEHLAQQTAASVEQLGVQHEQLLITGGGRHHDYLMERLGHHLEPLHISIAETSDELVDFKEAIIFAFLGLRALTGKPNTLKSVTGARQDAVCGSVHLPAGGGFAML